MSSLETILQLYFMSGKLIIMLHVERLVNYCLYLFPTTLYDPSVDGKCIHFIF